MRISIPRCTPFILTGKATGFPAGASCACFRFSCYGVQSARRPLGSWNELIHTASIVLLVTPENSQATSKDRRRRLLGAATALVVCSRQSAKRGLLGLLRLGNCDACRI